MIFTRGFRIINNPIIMVLIVYLVSVFFLPSYLAFAHKAIIFAYVDGNKIVCESKLSGGKKVRYGLIEAFDLKGNKLLEGKTDDRGHFSFDVPQKSSLKIVLHAGMGHRAEWIIHKEELEGIKPNPDASKSPVPLDPTSQDISFDHHMHQETDCLNKGEIQKIVESTLDQKLGPLNKKLSESLNQEPDFSDIMGGIGYIIGLVGLGAYFNYRRKINNVNK